MKIFIKIFIQKNLKNYLKKKKTKKTTILETLIISNQNILHNKKNKHLLNTNLLKILIIKSIMSIEC